MTTNPTPNLALLRPDEDEPIPNFMRPIGLDTGQNAFNMNTLDAILHELDGTYVPVWTAATVNPTLGNGTLTGKYFRLWPNLVVAHVRLVFGSTTNPGTGSYSFTLPFDAHADLPHGGADLGINPCLGRAAMNDNTSAAACCIGIPILRNAVNECAIFTESGGNSIIQHDDPIAWASGDQISFYAMYITDEAL